MKYRKNIVYIRCYTAIEHNNKVYIISTPRPDVYLFFKESSFKGFQKDFHHLPHTRRESKEGGEAKERGLISDQVDRTPEVNLMWSVAPGAWNMMPVRPLLQIVSFCNWHKRLRQQKIKPASLKNGATFAWCKWDFRTRCRSIFDTLCFEKKGLFRIPIAQMLRHFFLLSSSFWWWFDY